MAFIPQNYEKGHLVDLPMTAATYTKGQALIVTSGYYVTASASGGQEVPAVCMEGIVIGTTGDTAKCITTRGVKFTADCDAAPAQTDVGTIGVDLASATTVNPDATNADGTTNDYVFFIESIEKIGGKAVGTSTKVKGYFAHANPNV